MIRRMREDEKNMANGNYDLIVIGTGTAANVTAFN